MGTTMYVVRSFYGMEAHNCEVFFSEVWYEVQDYLLEDDNMDMVYLGYITVERVYFGGVDDCVYTDVQFHKPTKYR